MKPTDEDGKRFSTVWTENSLKISARNGKVRVVGPCGNSHTFISLDAAKASAARLANAVVEAEAQQAEIERVRREQAETVYPSEEMLSV